jgi:hypothetical protein
MRDVVHEPVGTPLPEELFQLNLSYLMLAQRLIAQDARQAEVFLGVKEPLTSWLLGASVSAITALANSPVAIHALRLPTKAAGSLLAACNDAQWFGPVHVAISALEVSHGRSR